MAAGETGEDADLAKGLAPSEAHQNTYDTLRATHDSEALKLEVLTTLHTTILSKLSLCKGTLKEVKRLIDKRKKEYTKNKKRANPGASMGSTDGYLTDVNECFFPPVPVPWRNGFVTPCTQSTHMIGLQPREVNSPWDRNTHLTLHWTALLSLNREVVKAKKSSAKRRQQLFSTNIQRIQTHASATLTPWTSLALPHACGLLNLKATVRVRHRSGRVKPYSPHPSGT